MSIFAISDLHLSNNCDKPMDIFGGVWDNYFEKIKEDWAKKVNNNDVVMICGDISWAMNLNQAKADLDEIANLSGNKIIIRGNHDYWWKSLSNIRDYLPTNFYVLQNDAIKIGDNIFCGSRGWQVPEQKFLTQQDEKIFNRELIRMEMALKCAKKLQINNENIIVMIHYPPFNSKFADSMLTNLFEKYGVKFVVYGHLHGINSRSVLAMEKNGIKYFLTSCDKVKNELVEIK